MNEKDFAQFVKMRYDQDPNGRLGKDGKDFIKSNKFTIRIVENMDGLSWGESHIGTKFGSTQDYGRRWEAIKQDKENQWSPNGEKTESDLIEEIRQRVSRHPRQIDFYDKDSEKVVTGVAVKLTNNGYAIYPDPEQLVSP